MTNFKLGTVSVPDGTKGDWVIDTFEIKDDSAMMIYNLRAVRDGHAALMVRPGTYRRLRHKERGIVMTNTPMEVRTNREAFDAATGRVLINGLGLGMLLEAILSKPDVTYVRVIEIEQDVIDLVGPTFAHDPRVEIIHADAMEYKPGKGEHFDYVWHDIWDELSSDNLPDMAKLGRRYGKRVAAGQGWWARDFVRAEQRRWEQS